MANKIDLSSPKAREHKRQVATYGTQTNLSSTAVERGSTRWLNGSTVVIEGLLDVTGTATVGGTLSVTGMLNASGQINLSGSTAITGPLNVTGTTTIGGNTNITGELNVTGPTTLDGILDIGGDTTITGALSIEGDSTISGKLDVTGDMSTKGTLSVEGVTTLKNDLNVTDGGKIKAGNLEIEPANGGQINFLNGSLSSTSFGALLNNTIRVELSGPVVDLSATKTNVNGQLEASGTSRFKSGVWMESLPTTSQPANLHITSLGQIFRSTATP